MTLTIEPGYGIDDFGNGIVDMPNSVAYVQRSLEVHLDFSLVAHTYPSKWPVPEGEDPGLHNTAGPWRWVFTPVEVPQDVDQLPVPISTVSGAVASNDGSQLIAFTESREITVQLFEGDWNVEFARADPDNPAGDAIYWKTVPLRIEDFLIVQLGDSYSSGQGAPEEFSPIGIWGDDGTVERFPLTAVDYSPCRQLLRELEINPAIMPNLAECMRNVAYGSDVNFEHELANRSSNTWGSLAAIDVEEFDSETSVTFINLAASGARLRHLDNTKRPLRPRFPPPQPSSDSELKELVAESMNDIELWYLSQEEYRLPAQLKQMLRLTRKREIDAVFITFGGNDVGFAAAIAAYIIRDPGESFTPIETALWTGEADDWNDMGLEAWFAEAFMGDFFPKSDRVGFDDLAGAYAGLDAMLRSDPYNIDPAKVYIAEYPDPLVSEPQYSVFDHYNAEVCPGPILTDKPSQEVGRREQNHARRQIIYPLNQAIAASAAKYGWNLVNTATLMYGRPICDDSRLVNLFKQSRDHQGDENGVIHPNEDGYKATADALLRVLHLRNSRPGDSVYSLQPPGSADYPVRPEDRELWHFTYAEKVSDSPPDSFDRPVWGTYGLNYQTDRVFLRVFPEWCQSTEVFVVEARIPQDVEGYPDSGGTSTLRYLSALPEYSLRIVAYQEGHGPKLPQSLLTEAPTWEFLTPPEQFTAGSHSIYYRFRDGETEGREFYVALTAPTNAESIPKRNARVATVSSYLSASWGLVQLRTRCELGQPNFTPVMPKEIKPIDPNILPTVTGPELPEINPTKMGPVAPSVNP